jgi:hypothetical protein
MPRSQNNCLNKWVLIPPSSNHWIKMLAKSKWYSQIWQCFHCTCTFGLTEDPRRLIKATVIIIKSITDTRYLTAIDKKSLAEQEKTLRKLQLLASTKSSYKYYEQDTSYDNTLIKRYNDLVLQHQKIWAISSDLMSFIRPHERME